MYYILYVCGRERVSILCVLCVLCVVDLFSARYVCVCVCVCVCWGEGGR
jgi:hypothetical protein